jgi:hypothetical protein
MPLIAAVLKDIPVDSGAKIVFLGGRLEYVIYSIYIGFTKLFCLFTWKLQQDIRSIQSNYPARPARGRPPIHAKNCSNP